MKSALAIGSKWIYWSARMDNHKRSDYRAEPLLRLLNVAELAGTFRQISRKYSVSQLDELGDQRFSGNIKKRF